MKKYIIYFLLLFFACWACKKDPITEISTDKSEVFESSTYKIPTDYPRLNPPVFNPEKSYGSVADIDGNIYKTIQIGNQEWMAENLRTTLYNDGRKINLAIGDMVGESEWFDLETGAYCWYYNDTVNKQTGAIYNWRVVATAKLAPEGWRVPTNADWETLIDYLGGETFAHDKLLCSGTNESGFSAVPSPILCAWGFGPEISFWSAESVGDQGANVPYAYYFSIWEENSKSKVSLFSEPQSFGFCVRCVKDVTP
jgi:uncharacterized protein (TIGR02145 family)